MRYPVTARTKDWLFRNSRPQIPGQSEAVPWCWYDTQAYVDNTTVRLTFFQVTNNDRSITNMKLAGQFEEGEYFEWYYLTLDVLRAPTTAAGGVTGAIDDLQRLVLTGRPFFTFKMSDKELGPIPVSLLHGTGGATGIGYGTFTAEESIQHAVNGIFDGGWCIDGSIVIPPNAGFNIVMEWPAAVDLTADVNLRVGMHGTRHRRVA